MTTTQDWQAKQAARKFAAEQLQLAHPQLAPAGDPLTTAAKNIRLELRAAFPGVKFSVKTSRFAGGDSIDVRWIDGPTSSQVEAIANRYAAGSFDGMTDSYNYERSAWTDAFGDAKYVSCSRDHSDRAITSSVRTVATRYGCAAGVNVENFAKAYKTGELWNCSPIIGGDRMNRSDWQSLVTLELSRRTWCITRNA